MKKQQRVLITGASSGMGRATNIVEQINAGNDVKEVAEMIL